MAKYRKKPVVIDAVCYSDTSSETICKVANFINRNEKDEIRFNPSNNTIKIPTLEGDMIASVGDYIIRGVKGECYPCKPDIFKQTYEPLVKE